MSHAQDRAGERYWLDVPNRQIWEIIGAIQEGKSVCIEKQNKDISKHLVLFKNRPLKIIYSNKDKVIITMYPFDLVNDEKYLQDLYSRNNPKGTVYLLDYDLNEFLNLKIFKTNEWVPFKRKIFRLSLNNKVIHSSDYIEDINDFIHTDLKDLLEIGVENLDSLNLLKMDTDTDTDTEIETKIEKVT